MVFARRRHPSSPTPYAPGSMMKLWISQARRMQFPWLEGMGAFVRNSLMPLKRLLILNPV
jgi:hypothetical protein